MFKFKVLPRLSISSFTLPRILSYILSPALMRGFWCIVVILLLFNNFACHRLSNTTKQINVAGQSAVYWNEDKNGCGMDSKQDKETKEDGCFERYLYL